jgi:hypothetical protein
MIRSAAQSAGDLADEKRAKFILDLLGDMLGRDGNIPATLDAMLASSDPPLAPLSADEREAVRAAVRARRMPRPVQPEVAAKPKAEALEVRVFSVPLPGN